MADKALALACHYQNLCCDLEEIIELFCMDADAIYGLKQDRQTTIPKPFTVMPAQVNAALKAACLRDTPESRKDMERAIRAAHNIKES